MSKVESPLAHMLTHMLTHSLTALNELIVWVFSCSSTQVNDCVLLHSQVEPSTSKAWWWLEELILVICPRII